jgi:hypothetical protein
MRARSRVLILPERPRVGERERRLLSTRIARVTRSINTQNNYLSYIWFTKGFCRTITMQYQYSGYIIVQRASTIKSVL